MKSIARIVAVGVCHRGGIVSEAQRGPGAGPRVAFQVLSESLRRGEAGEKNDCNTNELEKRVIFVSKADDHIGAMSNGIGPHKTMVKAPGGWSEAFWPTSSWFLSFPRPSCGDSP